MVHMHATKSSVLSVVTAVDRQYLLFCELDCEGV